MGTIYTQVTSNHDINANRTRMNVGVLDPEEKTSKTKMDMKPGPLLTEIKQESFIKEEPFIKEEILDEEEVDISDIVIKEELSECDLLDYSVLTVEHVVKLAPFANDYALRKCGDRIKRLRQKICPLCKKTFVTSYLRLHLQTHEEFSDEKVAARKVECEICKMLVTPQAYPSHKRLHTGERPFICATCGLSFVRLSAMRSHEGVHNGERPFVCPVCKKGFRQKKYLNLHIKIHTGEKEYECNECGKQFTFRPSLMIHLRVHADDKRYICPVCDKRCITKMNLKTHMVTHTKERKYECAACGDKFAQASHMKTHVTMYCKGEPKSATKICTE